MEHLIQYHEAAAAAIARVILGVLFFFQGYDAVFGVKLKNVVSAVEGPLREKGLPHFAVLWGTWFTSFAQLTGGFLLIIGLFKTLSLYILGIDLLVAVLGFSLASPIWDTRHVLPRLALLLFLLLLPASWDIFSLDHLLFNNR